MRGGSLLLYSQVVQLRGYQDSGIYVLKFISQITYPKADPNANNLTSVKRECWAHCDLMSQINYKPKKMEEEETVISLPSNKMLISQTYMVIILFPDYNAPISMHGPD